MLGKLFKHDFASTVKPLLLFSIIALAVAGAGIGLKYLLSLPVLNEEKLYSVKFILSMMVVACVFAMFAFVLLILVLVVVRYYRNLFTEEGYLTFTLPTTTGKILLSKYLSGCLTMFITIVVGLTGLALLTFVLPGKILGTPLTFPDLLEFLTDGFTNSPLICIEFCALIPLTASEILLLLYFSVTLGSLLAKKLKLFASFGIFYGFMTILNTLRSVLLSVFILNIANILVQSKSNQAMSVFLLLMIGLSLLVNILSYLFSYLLLKKKLNI